MPSVATALKKGGYKAKPKAARQPFWKGPEIEGVTQGLISRFLVCRERLRLRLIEGLGLPEKFNARMEYGDLWHVCEEEYLAGRDWQRALLLKAQEKVKQHGPQDSREIEKWYQLCKRQFPRYVQYWANHPSKDSRKPLLQEYEFNVPYTLPSGRVVRVRGKMDAVELSKAKTTKGVWLQENKTKGYPDERKIQRELSFDLQTMTYLSALYRIKDNIPGAKGHPIRGVMYNVIRRPLAGGRGSIVQKEARTRKPKNKAEREKYGESVPVPGESDAEYYDRLMHDYLDKEPEYWFMRWDSFVTEREVGLFEEQCLRPVLQQIVDWWDYVAVRYAQNQPPWGTCHWRHPFNVYNVLNEGGSSEYDEYLSSGDASGLTKITKVFPELSS